MKLSSFVKLPLSTVSRAVVTTPGGLIQEFNVLYKCFHILREKMNELRGDLVLLTNVVVSPFSFIHVNSFGQIELADNTSLAKRAHGFSVEGGGPGIFIEAAFKSFLLEGLSGLIPGSTYYLSDTPGQMTLVPPVSSGSIVQEVGTAITNSDFLVQITAPSVIP